MFLYSQTEPYLDYRAMELCRDAAMLDKLQSWLVWLHAFFPIYTTFNLTVYSPELLLCMILLYAYLDSE